jgi:hypothetical protein
MLVPHACRDKYEWCIENLGLRHDESVHIDMAALHCPTNNGHVRVNHDDGGEGSRGWNRNPTGPFIADAGGDDDNDDDDDLDASTTTPTRVITCWSHNKHLECTEPGSVLIDDRLDLREAWEAAGGVFVHHTTTENTIRRLQQLGVLVEGSSSSSSGFDDDEDVDDRSMTIAQQLSSSLSSSSSSPSDQQQEQEQEQYQHYYWDGSSYTSTRKWGWW